MRFWHATFVLLFVTSLFAAAPKYSYRTLLDANDPANAIGFWIQFNSIDNATGAVAIGAGFKGTWQGGTVDWGDGTTSKAALPSLHTYTDLTRNYVLTVNATISGVATKASLVARFAAAPNLPARSFDPSLTVTIPATMPSFRDTYFNPGMFIIRMGSEAFASFDYPFSRTVVERVLNAFSEIENDLVNRNVYRASGSFNQVALRLPGNVSAVSFWHASPPFFCISDAFINATSVGWGTFAHEMGHNYSINCPATFRSGGRNDGNGGALWSEAVARIFEYVACHTLANNAAAYGIPEEVAADVFLSEATKLRTSTKPEGDKIVTGAAKFSAWNDPATSTDETNASFCLLATKFLEADPDGTNYRTNTKRLMWFFEHWSPSWISRWDSKNNTEAATTFRSTVMVTALSYATGRDWRSEFRGYGFPVDDTISAELLATVGTYPGDDTPVSRLANISTRAKVSGGSQDLISGFVITGGSKKVLLRAIGPTLASFGLEGTLDAPLITLYKGTDVIASNAGWSKAANALAIKETAAALGAFALSSGSKDAALLVDLEPGAYSAQISSADGRYGVAMVEIYEVSGSGQLSNLSTRAQALSGTETLIPGFVITGVRSKNLLIRCAGPTLGAYGVEGALAKPSITLYRGDAVVATNAGWSAAHNALEIAAASRTANAFTFQENSGDAAMFVALPPGLYTVMTVGADGKGGVGLVEVYDLDVR